MAVGQKWGNPKMEPWQMEPMTETGLPLVQFCPTPKGEKLRRRVLHPVLAQLQQLQQEVRGVEVLGVVDGQKPHGPAGYGSRLNLIKPPKSRRF